MSNHKQSTSLITDFSIIVILVLAINLLTMPKVFYPGDSYAIKQSAMNLLNSNEFGITPTKKNADRLKAMNKIKGQYFHHNSSDSKYYSRWGFFNTLLSAIPEFFNNGEPNHLLKVNNTSIINHNILNILVSIAVALLLYFICAFFTEMRLTRLIYVFSVLYSTFVWNYMRAQSYDLIHLFFFLSFIYFFIKSLHAPRKIWTILWNVSLWLLILSKDSFFVIYVAIFLYFLFFSPKQLPYSKRVKSLIPIVFSLLVPLTLIIITNKLHFQEWIFTKKASHAPYDPKIIPFSINYYLPRLFDYFLSLKTSLFYYFPVLIFSLLGARTFARKNKSFFLFISSIFLISLLALGSFYSIGEWCYGPRFFLFILPVLSLPAIIFIDYIFSLKGFDLKKIISLTIFSIVIIYSTNLQMHHNSRHFFVKYYLEAQFSSFKNPKTASYFQEMPTNFITMQFNHFLKDGAVFFPVSETLKSIEEISKKEFLTQIHYLLKSNHQCNYYFDLLCKVH